MSNTNSIKTQLWEKMKSKKYRDAFATSHLSINIASQIETMREERDWLQKDLATKCDMSPARISVMEDPSYDKWSLTTLKRLASAFDVALIVRFVPFSEVTEWAVNVSHEKLSVLDYSRDSLIEEPACISVHLTNTDASGATVGGFTSDKRIVHGAYTVMPYAETSYYNVSLPNYTNTRSVANG